MRATVSGGRRTVGAVAVAAMAIGLVAACGSSSKPNAGTTSASSSSASSQAATPTGTPIKIGMIGSNSGSQAATCDQGATVGPAWAAWVNANGGINGHPVEMTSVDDKGDPVAAQAAGKQLINAGMAAVVAGCDNLLPAYDTDKIAAKIPVVSGPSNSQDWYTKVGLFPTPTDNVSGLQAQIAVAKQFGHATKFANIYCAEVTACGQANPVLKAAADKAGIGYTSLAISSTATSYTSQCLSLQQQKVDYAQLNFVVSAAIKFIADCQAQGYNPIFGTSEQSIGNGTSQIKGATLYGPAYAFPETPNVPVVQTFNDAMTKYAKGSDWHDGTASFAWSGLEMIRKALMDANVPASTPVTAATVMSALYNVKDENLGGLLSNKVSYTAGKPVGLSTNPCYFVVGVDKNGKPTAPNGLTPICPSAS